MSDHVSNSVPPQEPVIKTEEGWTSVSNSVRETTDDAPVELADKTADDAVDDEKTEKVDETKADDGKKAADSKVDDDETPEQKASKRKERSRDRVQRIRAEIAAATKAKHEQPAVETKPEPKVETKTEVEAPKKPSWEEFEAAGKSFQEYQDARDEFIRADLLKELKAETEKTADEKIKAKQAEDAAATRRQQYQARLDAAKAKTPDFDAVINEGMKDVPASPFFDAVVKNHPFGPEIAYALAKDPDMAFEVAHLQPPRHVYDLIKATDSAEIAVHVLEYLTDHDTEYEDICRSHPIVAAKKLSKIEASFERVHDGSRSGRPVSKASPPTRPVRGGHSETTSRSRASADDDIVGYITRENRAEARRHGLR